MTALHYTPYFKNYISTPSLAWRTGDLVHESKTSFSPPYNLIKNDEETFTLIFSVAGFKKEELDIQIEENILTVSGTVKNDDTQASYLHQGFNKQNFRKQFRLDETMEITKAQLDSGLLTVSLTKKIPEQSKPVSIAIQHND